MHTNLAGEWRVILLECLPGESACAQKLAGMNPDQTIRAGRNLRVKFPFFFGRLKLIRQFHLRPEQIHADHEYFLNLGALGSIDRTYLNGRLIGSRGLATGDGNYISAWSAPRSYRIGPELLRTGVNTITIELIVLDEKAGLHRTPVHISGADSSQYRLKFLYEYIPVGITLLFLFTSIYVLAILVFRLTPPGYIYFFLAAFAYIFFSLHYFEFPIPVDYAWFYRLHLLSGYVTSGFNVLFFMHVLGYRQSGLIKPILICTLAGGVAHLLFGELYSIFILSRVAHGLVFLLLVGVTLAFLVISTRESTGSLRRVLLLFLIPSVAIAALMNGWDYLVRLDLINGPYIFNYSAYGYFLVILVLNSYQLQSSTRRVLEYRSRLSNERNRIAGDLHDWVGSELTGAIMFLEARSRTDGQLQSLVYQLKEILERLRDLVFFLNRPDEEAYDLHAVIGEYIERLIESGRYTAQKNLQEISLSLAVSLHAQKIFYEWMANCLRHGDARHFHIRWELRRGKAVLVIQSDGASFSWNGKRTSGMGVGLSSMSQRARQIGARVRSVAIPDGTLFVLTVPVP
ncbi:MAG: hypothetical protein KDK30_14425 [Leptospiraceae bacterium]|nr:hypothetical protein [Leptospiraceae bacterium]